MAKHMLMQFAADAFGIALRFRLNFEFNTSLSTKILSPVKGTVNPYTKVVYTKNLDKEYFKSNSFDYIIVVPFVDTVDTLVAAWLPGPEGQGVANVLFGDYGFIRKLARTWFKSIDDPLYPFGFGLTTTRTKAT
ncbi:putative glycoside hydrolase family 3 C-terminal domain-containing protein [Tanacetum coccineum]